MDTAQRHSVKRELEKSPAKPQKKSKESLTVSKEELDSAILNGIKQALLEQQRGLDAAVKLALDGVLSPQINALKLEVKNTSEMLKAVSSELEQQNKDLKQLKTRVDSIQVAARSDRETASSNTHKIEELTAKLVAQEDRSRRSNVRLVGLRESAEGGDAIAFLRHNLPKWIPSLANRDIPIERAHRVYGGKDKKGEEVPRTLIFKLLNYADRQDVLKGARASPIRHDQRALLFFPDYSNETSKKRKEMSQLRKRLESAGYQPFLIYPATLKLTHRGRQLFLTTPAAVEEFLQSACHPTAPAEVARKVNEHSIEVAVT